MTSEGGGAVAYPVLTLAIKAEPDVARDVALMVQACGMSTASFAILFQHIQVGPTTAQPTTYSLVRLLSYSFMCRSNSLSGWVGGWLGARWVGVWMGVWVGGC